MPVPCSRNGTSPAGTDPLLARRDVPIRPGVEEQVWTFSRDGQSLEIKRTPTNDGILLGVNGDGPPRSYFFSDLPKLQAFQADFEKFLLATGWTFLAFSPERRTGRERRHFSRLISDRRRWWTDGVRKPVSRGVDGEGDRPATGLRRRRPR